MYEDMAPKNKKRTYRRKCGGCGRAYNQKDMYRTDLSTNGWYCEDCYFAIDQIIHNCYSADEF